MKKKTTTLRQASKQIREALKEIQPCNMRGLAFYLGYSHPQIKRGGATRKAFDNLIKKGEIIKAGNCYYLADDVGVRTEPEAQNDTPISTPAFDKQALMDNLMDAIEQVVEFRLHEEREELEKKNEELREENQKLKTETENKFLGKIFGRTSRAERIPARDS